MASLSLNLPASRAPPEVKPSMFSDPGFEVFIRNVAPQSTEKALNKFLKPHLSTLSIVDFDCQKQRDKPFASLTFLFAREGERFLAQHGQSGPKHSRKPARQNLSFLGKPIYCEKSNRDPNPWHLRTLSKAMNDRKSRVLISTKPSKNSKPLKIFPVLFNCSSVSCGVWTYLHNDAVFAPQNTWVGDLSAKFGERSMILTFESGLRIDFHYDSIRSITTEEGSGASFIFTMHEPPLFFQKINDDTVSDLFSLLNIQNGAGNIKRKNGAQRHRITCLDEQHKLTAGSCLVYRVALTQFRVVGRAANPVSDKIESLRKAHGMPYMAHRRTRVHQPRSTWIHQYDALQRALTSLASTLSFEVKFQVQKLAQDGYLSPESVLELLPSIERILERSEKRVCVAAIRKLFHQLPFAEPDTEADAFDFATLERMLHENEKLAKREVAFGDPERSENVAIIHRAKITPTGVHLYGPEAETNNRVLRKYAGHHDYFLRVQFCDENGQPVRFNPRISNENIFRGRYKEVLRRGINIAGRVFEFLGFSHSSLRAQSCWFMAPLVHNDTFMLVKHIISKLGDFTVIRSPAKCAARIGQAFSDTRIAVPIDPSIVYEEQDVQFGERVFSDGVGTISQSVVDNICGKLGKKAYSRPTCFQIRYQGAKGMVSLDSRLRGDAMVLRPSMIKYSGSDSTDIEICESAYRPLPMYLNRQLIKILEDMGVSDDFFMRLQAKEVERLRLITSSPANASSFLKRQNIGDSNYLPWLINKLAMLNLDFRRDGFLRDVLETALLNELRLLKHKTRIPVEKGWHLHGLMDETGLLKEGEIYCVVTVEGRRSVITGDNLIVTRAPALHPGDVQLVKGIMPPAGSPLLELSNCICFSKYGRRDLPSQLSGGDLDGDRYYIMWDEGAIPKNSFEPADYPRLDPIDIGRAVERDDMTNFFIEFMETDQLGRIAVLHRVLADQKVDGTLDPECLVLAGMHSTAVDFSKTGIPVDMNQMPKYNRFRPDFEAPGPQVKVEKLEGIVFESPPDYDDDDDDLGDEDDDFTKIRYYESKKILGKLYRAIDERRLFEGIKNRAENPDTTRDSTVIEQAWRLVQRACRLIQWEHKLEWARDIRDMYEENIYNAMNDYSEHPTRPLSELEAFIGNILGKTGAQSKSQRELSTTLKEKVDADTEFIVDCILKDGTEWSEEALERTMACLAVSLEERASNKRREKLVSFKYVAAAVCLREAERTFAF